MRRIKMFICSNRYEIEDKINKWCERTNAVPISMTNLYGPCQDYLICLIYERCEEAQEVPEERKKPE